MAFSHVKVNVGPLPAPRSPEGQGCAVRMAPKGTRRCFDLYAVIVFSIHTTGKEPLTIDELKSRRSDCFEIGAAPGPRRLARVLSRASRGDLPVRTLARVREAPPGARGSHAPAPGTARAAVLCGSDGARAK